MPRGAAPGERRGGRAKGTPNRRTQEQVDAILESGDTPLDYMIGVMRDESAAPAVRLDAAGKAAPFVHPKLSSSTVSMEADIDLTSSRHVAEMTDLQLIIAVLQGDAELAKEVRTLIDSRLDALAASNTEGASNP